MLLILKEFISGGSRNAKHSKNPHMDRSDFFKKINETEKFKK